MELDELKKPSDITGGTLKERYHIPEGYNKLLQKIEKAREVLKKIRFSLTGGLDLGDTSLSPEDYRRSIDPLFDFVMEYTDGIVNPGPDHIGEEFTGSYISPEYKEYSVKHKQGAKESDASYQRYLARREESLNNAAGTPVKTVNFPGVPIPDQSRSIDHLCHHRRSKGISFYSVL